METTTMQFNSHEGCFSQPYSCRPIDAAPTDYPWTHGITATCSSPDSAHHTQVVVWLKPPLQESASVR